MSSTGFLRARALTSALTGGQRQQNGLLRQRMFASTLTVPEFRPIDQPSPWSEDLKRVSVDAATWKDQATAICDAMPVFRTKFLRLVPYGMVWFKARPEAPNVDPHGWERARKDFFKCLGLTKLPQDQQQLLWDRYIIDLYKGHWNHENTSHVARLGTLAERFFFSHLYWYAVVIIGLILGYMHYGFAKNVFRALGANTRILIWHEATSNVMMLTLFVFPCKYLFRRLYRFRPQTLSKTKIRLHAEAKEKFAQISGKASA
eukprot:TRINITY_DN4447_c0_g1_i1.p1 TRINITY_DN4447_c0_g1~~TRINITY_DN4447_c0_g1_i1.p1  ORF type:complete len:260 (-),score=5.26 TRINITY_DN4447_c0_g1_i1:270-1049(-)